MNKEINWKKNIALFLAGQAISLFGSALVQFAITTYIALTTKSGIDMTIAILCGFLPMLILSPFAGVWADRYNKKHLIIIADSVIALATLVIAVLFLLGIKDNILLFVVLTIRGFGSAVQSPCVTAMLPSIVAPEFLPRANGINMTVQSLITLASPMLGGVLLTFMTIEFIFFIDVVTAAAAVFVMLFFFKFTPAKKEKEAHSSHFDEIKQGLAYIFRHKYLKLLCLYCLIFCFMCAPCAFLSQLHVVREYGDDVWRLATLDVVFSVGMMLGGILMSIWGGMKNRMRTAAFALLFMGASVVLMGVPSHFVFFMAMMTLCGFSMPCFNTPFTVVLQQNVDENYMGRVFSLITMINSVAMPLGMAVFGPISDYVSIHVLFLITGGVILVTALTLIVNKTLTEIGGKKPVATE